MVSVKKIILISLFFIFSFSLGVFFFLFEREWVDFSTLEYFVPARPSVLLDDEGHEFARYELDKRELVTFEKLPSVLINAFIAAEDHNFFNHYGISLKGILRSLLINLYHRKVVQGASTITQQLARLMFLSYERLYERKIQEAFLAFQIERQFTKKQILELYVNSVYFGRGIYGVEAACRRFWNKGVVDITIDEAATLAAVAKSARLFSPLNSMSNAKQRRNIVLRSMFLLKAISKEQFNYAVQKSIVIQDYLPGNAVRLYIQEWIRQWAEQKWGKDVLYQKGLRIKTTINKKTQDLAELLFCNKICELRKKIGDELNGGFMSIEASTGKIKACIGGYDFRESQFNRAFQAVRQMGSSFKPIVYTAALDSGIGLDSIDVDEPLELSLPGCSQVWSPKNWTHRFDGRMTLAKALAFSNNIITVKTLLKVGIEKVIELAKRFRINRELMPYPSIALGTAEATVEENVAAFNVFANNGTYVKPFLVEWVKDEWGQKIWEYEISRIRILDSKLNSQMVNALSLRLKVAKRVVGDKNWINSEVIGKTGSTNEAGTTWYVGATPELTTAVYLGRDDNKPMGRLIFGYQTAYPIWLEFYKKLTFKKKSFYVDPELKEVFIDWVTGFVSHRFNNPRIVTILK